MNVAARKNYHPVVLIVRKESVRKDVIFQVIHIVYG